MSTFLDVCSGEIRYDTRRRKASRPGAEATRSGVRESVGGILGDCTVERESDITGDERCKETYHVAPATVAPLLLLLCRTYRTDASRACADQNERALSCCVCSVTLRYTCRLTVHEAQRAFLDSQSLDQMGAAEAKASDGMASLDFGEFKCALQRSNS